MTDRRLLVHRSNKKLSCFCDSRSYCVLYIWYTGKLSKRFRLQVLEQCTIRSTGRVYERTQTLSTQAWPLSVTDQSSVVQEISE